MSQIKFEFLPNEILFQCFHYLNIIDIYHSFDQLNDRFNTLLRNIQFSLNFANIHNKFQCEEFCHKLLTDERIQNQLYSLYLSNGNTCYPIHLFLSKFSLLQFSHLRSLTLYKTTDKNWKSIQSILSSIPDLSFFRMSGCCLSDNIISQVPISQLQTLIIPTQSLPKSISNIQFSSITYLSISGCNLDQCFFIFNDASKLNYLKIRYLSVDIKYMRKDDIRCFNNPANNLKTLHINHFESTVDYLFIILEQTPNLENLLLLDCVKSNIINANKWQRFITSSLTRLKNFKFEFHAYDFPTNDIDVQCLKEFQNDFWLNQHHWHTEYIISESSAFIYTIPYPTDVFELEPNGQRYFNQSIDHTKAFINIKDLTVHHKTQRRRGQYYFSNVKSLSLGNPNLSYRNYTVDGSSHLSYLQTIIDLSNIKHLTALYSFCFRTTNIFKEIFKTSMQLTSLTISSYDLLDWFDDDELCKYLNKSIRKLKIFYDQFNNSHQLEKFCKTFTNLEELECSINDLKTLFLIKHLPKLTYVENEERRNKDEMYMIKKEIEQLQLDITAEFSDEDYPLTLYIWINRI